jgi:hypothetical protein
MFFHILLWDENNQAKRDLIESGMQRMQNENANDMKKMIYGYLLPNEKKEESQSGVFIKDSDGFKKIAPAYNSFFIMDFQDEESYKRYISSEAHDNPQASHGKSGFAWDVCATMWSKYLATDFLHESAFTFQNSSIFGEASILHMVLWEMNEDVPEKIVTKMFQEMKKFKDTIPNIGYLSFGRKFLGTNGSECLVHEDRLVPRGTGPLPYEKINEAPNFGFIAGFKNQEDLDNYRNSKEHKEFVNKFVIPYWNKIYRHELKITFG